MRVEDAHGGGAVLRSVKQACLRSRALTVLYLYWRPQTGLARPSPLIVRGRVFLPDDKSLVMVRAWKEDRVALQPSLKSNFAAYWYKLSSNTLGSYGQ